MKNLLLIQFLLVLLVFYGTCEAQKQSGRIAGKVSDRDTKEGVAFASVQLMRGELPVQQVVANFNGDFTFRALLPGRYSVKGFSIGYTLDSVKNILVKAGQTKKVEVVLAPEVKTTQEVVVMEYKRRLIAADEGMKVSLSAEEIAKIPTRNVNKATRTKAHQAGVNIRGNRTTDNAVFVNGVRQFGASLPPAENQEEYAHTADNSFQNTKRHPLSTFCIDVDKTSYSNVRRMLNEGHLPTPDAVRIEEMVNYFEYEYPQPEGDLPFSVTTEYTDCPWNRDHHILHIGLQGRKVAMDKMPPNNLVFLIDVSGSMDEPDKLPLVKSSLRLLVNQLRPVDRVAMVVYAGAAGVVLPPTPGHEKEKILHALESLNAGGSTAGGEGIELAYKLAKENQVDPGNNRIILATDGDFNVGVSSEGDLEHLIEDKRKDHIFLSVLGFGTGNYKDSKMELLADKGNGNYAYIDNLTEGHKVLVKEMGGTLLTIAKDVKLQLEFNPRVVKAYRLVGYENRMLEDKDFNDDAKDAGELGAGHTVTALYEIIPAGSAEETDSVDALKYQAAATSGSSTGANTELMTLKLRYKAPRGLRSRLITHVQRAERKELVKASENCRFSCSVAEFGMLLRDSRYKGRSDFDEVLSIARDAKGKDTEGYRAEFIRLVAMAEDLRR